MDMNCDVCGIDLKDEDGYAIQAVEVALLGANSARKRVEDIFGKFKFRICHVCYLKALGVKTLKDKEKSQRNRKPEKPG